MSRLLVMLAAVVVLCATVAFGQEAKQESTAASVSKPCVIVKHKGTVGRRLMWTALIGVPIAPGAKYDLVDSMGYTPARVTFKGKELQTMQQQGIHVVVLEKNYKANDLDVAKRSCQENNIAAPSVQGKQSGLTEKAKSPE
jgi:hypothetical protein